MIKPDYNQLYGTEKYLKERELIPNQKMINQLAFYFLEEKIFNESTIKPENVFYCKQGVVFGYDYLKSYRQQRWLETIEEAVKITETWASNIDQNAQLMTRALAIEGLKSVVEKGEKI